MQLFNTHASPVTHTKNVPFNFLLLPFKFSMAHFCILFGTFFTLKPFTGEESHFLKIFPEKGAF